tara:strand:+ start:794 stop:1237 length:444 start_codon:yes stop_codon:yes gene_type:complete
MTKKNNTLEEAVSTISNLIDNEWINENMIGGMLYNLNIKVEYFERRLREANEAKCDYIDEQLRLGITLPSVDMAHVTQQVLEELQTSPSAYQRLVNQEAEWHNAYSAITQLFSELSVGYTSIRGNVWTAEAPKKKVAPSSALTALAK